jgi:hypothetical protein
MGLIGGGQEEEVRRIKQKVWFACLARNDDSYAMRATRSLEKQEDCFYWNAHLMQSVGMTPPIAFKAYFQFAQPDSSTARS